ncbi:MAG TPA: chemotaxis protein CheW [Novosphingobium sp.]|nr:chemotaxis protein CheW [Novosphingobium sp.]
MASAPALSEQTLTFSVGERRLGLPASIVLEVAPVPRIARVPHAPPALLGVASLRGAVVPVLSVARLLGEADGAMERVVVVDLDGPVGLAVTGVSHVVDDREADAVARIDVAALVARAIPARPQRRAAGSGIAVSDVAGTAQTETVALVAFAVGGQDFALPLATIGEVMRLPPEIARMPHADGVVVGTIAARGAVLPLLSLAALLALPVQPATARSRIVVVRIGAHRVGMVVDAMRSIARVPESEIDPVPQALNRGGPEARIQAICRMEGGGRLLSVLAPDQLLREDITARLLQGLSGDEQEMTDAATPTRGHGEDERFLLFRIGEDTFGLPIAAVQEIVPLPPRLTPLPKAPDFVLGVMTVRGQVIPVIDQSRRFHGTPTAGAKPRVIVVQIGTLTAGFLVDAVSEVAQVAAAELRDAPELGTGGARVFDRVAALDGRDALVLIVSPQELLDRAERDLLASLGRKAAKTAP